MKTDHLTPEQIAQVIGPLLPYGFGTAVAQQLALAVLAAAPEPPIAMPTEEECAQFTRDFFADSETSIDRCRANALRLFVSRRNSPPEPSLREKIEKILREGNTIAYNVDVLATLVEKEKAQ